MKAELDAIFEKPTKSSRWRRGLTPNKILTKQEALRAKPEDQLVLQCAAFASTALGAIVEYEAPGRLESAKDLSGHTKKIVLEPRAFITLGVAIL